MNLNNILKYNSKNKITFSIILINILNKVMKLLNKLIKK